MSNLVILLTVMIKPNITYGSTNIYERINEYNKSIERWNIIADQIPYKIYIFENSGYGNVFNLNPKITYFSEYVNAQELLPDESKGRSVAYVMKRFLELVFLNDDDKILFINGRYGPTKSLDSLFSIIFQNDVVVNGHSPEHGSVNTRWHSTTVKLLKEFVGLCLILCHDQDGNVYENVFIKIIEKYGAYYYMDNILIIPTYEGGMRLYREFI